MKTEPRGKYSGLKIHLEGPECQELLDWRKLYKSGNASNSPVPLTFTKSIAKAIAKALEEHPDLLKDRTEEQIQAALKKDKDKIEKQLATMKSGQDWKQVK